MRVYLDTNLVIDYVDCRLPWVLKVEPRLQQVESDGDRWALRYLTRMECLVLPLRLANNVLLLEFENFFLRGNVDLLTVRTPIYDRASRIRAKYNVGALDSIHLASAVYHKCGLFLTRDARLARCPDIAVEVIT